MGLFWRIWRFSYKIKYVSKQTYFSILFGVNIYVNSVSKQDCDEKTYATLQKVQRMML